MNGILGSLAWLTHTGSKKSCLSKRPTKAAQTGVGSRSGVVSFPSLQKPHTGPHKWDSEEIRLCCQLVFRISSFLSPFQKVLFFVYAAQFLYRRLHHSIPLIMFHRTLLGGMKTFSFASRLRNKMHFLKPPQNCSKHRVTWHQVLFPYLDRESLTQAHTAGHAGRSCLTFVPDAFFLCTSRDIFSICCW